jgi:colanic acid biosynthesis protein WcaH
MRYAAGMTDEQFLHIVSATPLVSIDLVVRDETGRVLLGQRLNRPAPGSWFVPGGRIRTNERVAEALRRISERALGVVIPEARLVGGADQVYPGNVLGAPGVDTHYVVLEFLTEMRGETRFTHDDQHAALRWWKVEDLLAAPDVHENTKAYFRA